MGLLESQRADAANLVTHREEKEANSVSSTNANQPVTGPDGTDKGTLKLSYLKGTANEDKSSFNSSLNKDQAHEIIHLHKIKEGDAPDDDDDDSGDSNGGNGPDSQANPSKATETNANQEVTHLQKSQQQTYPQPKLSVRCRQTRHQTKQTQTTP